MATVGRFVALGRCRTKGSMKPQLSRAPGGKLRVHMVESGEHSVSWKRTMIKAIWDQCGITPIRRGSKIIGFDPDPFSNPVRVNAVFAFECERSVAIEKDGKIWPSHDTSYPTADDIGDFDKLERNLLDALTQSGLIKDDRLVVGPRKDLDHEKIWVCDRFPRPGVYCEVTAA